MMHDLIGTVFIKRRKKNYILFCFLEHLSNSCNDCRGIISRIVEQLDWPPLASFHGDTILVLMSEYILHDITKIISL
jgi:hypothetical protein